MPRRWIRRGLVWGLTFVGAGLALPAWGQEVDVPTTPDGHPDYRPPPFPTPQPSTPYVPPSVTPDVTPEPLPPAKRDVPPVPPPPPEPDGELDYSASYLPLFRLGFTTDRILPERSRFSDAWNFGLDSEVAAHVPFGDSGLGMVFGLRLAGAYGTDENFTVDGNVAFGPALNLGPVTLAPIGALGGTTRTGGDGERSYRVGGDLYGQVGGRLRFGLEGFGFDASVARNFFFGLAEPFDDPIDDPFFDDPFFDRDEPEPAAPVAHQTRVDLRLFMSEGDSGREYFLGGYWLRSGGSTGYSDADQFGGTIGIAWARPGLDGIF